jgi:hypothetical protein
MDSFANRHLPNRHLANRHFTIVNYDRKMFKAHATMSFGQMVLAQKAWYLNEESIFTFFDLGPML